MSRRHIPMLAFAAIALLLAGEFAALWSQLPARLATHFGLSGEPNDWSTPAELVRSASLLVAMCAAVFLLAPLLERLPDRLINLPNKDYWLAPDRRSATFGAMRDWLRWLMVVTLAIVALVMTLIIHANLSSPPRLRAPELLVLAAILGPILGMIAGIFWRFRAPRH
jgi:uncharacterized membrane protein